MTTPETPRCLHCGSTYLERGRCLDCGQATAPTDPRILKLAEGADERRKTPPVPDDPAALFMSRRGRLR